MFLNFQVKSFTFFVHLAKSLVLSNVLLNFGFQNIFDMNQLLSFSLTVFTGIFAIMNPIAMTPAFLGLVEDRDQKSKKRIAKKASIIAFIIVASFVILGKGIFDVFDITVPAFKITGGILVFYVGFEMLMSKQSKIQNTDNTSDSDDIATSPLAIPILAGPGTIVTAMNFASHTDYIHIGIVILIVALICVITYIVFKSSDFIVRTVGNNIIEVIGKIMGLIIAIIGTDMMISGIKLAFNLA